MRGVWGAGNWEAPPPHLIRSSVSEKRFGATRSTTVPSWTVLSSSWHLGRCSSSLNDRQSSGTGRQGKPCLTLARQNRGGSTTTVISDPSPVSCSPAAAYRSRWQAAGAACSGSSIQHPASGIRHARSTGQISESDTGRTTYEPNEARTFDELRVAWWCWLL